MEERMDGWMNSWTKNGWIDGNSKFVNRKIIKREKILLPDIRLVHLLFGGTVPYE